jgi:Methyltransferase domain
MSAASRLKRAVSALLANEEPTGSQREFVPAGHFYSPLPDLDAIKESFKPDDGLAGIDMEIDAQCRFVDVIESFYPDLPFSDHPGVGGTGTRFGYVNDFFGHSDAITLFTMLRALRPRQVIEVGSGHSSAVMLDTRARFLPDTALCFIEPYPDRLKSLLRSGDDFELIEDKVQNVSIDRFAALQDGDILFIDSSHVSKAGSDVNDLFFRVLPALAVGVVVHVHDILWPFEYPVEWLLEGRAWNEAYLLRAFLQYNRDWEVLYMNDYMGKQQSELVAQKAPLMLVETGGSFWMRRVR